MGKSQRNVGWRQCRSIKCSTKASKSFTFVIGGVTSMRFFSHNSRNSFNDSEINTNFK
jgi:hypothetical protein